MRVGYIGIFTIFNLTALALGGLLTSEGVPSNWYMELNKAPWTPPGWVFGAAWTIIMVCFGIFMGICWEKTERKKQLLTVYILQWILNVGWNFLFFKLHLVLFGLIELLLFIFLLIFLYMRYREEIKLASLFLLPYLIWLGVAISLNAYILFFN